MRVRALLKTTVLPVVNVEVLYVHCSILHILNLNFRVFVDSAILDFVLQLTRNSTIKCFRIVSIGVYGKRILKKKTDNLTVSMTPISAHLSRYPCNLTTG